MADTIKYLINQLKLQTRLFHNVTSGISDADAIKAMNGHTVHIAWLTGHTVSTRYSLANALGCGVREPFPELFRNEKPMDRTAIYPSMQELTRDWDSVSGTLEKALLAVSEETLSAKLPGPVPTGDTLGDLVAFLIHHEAYTLGQLGIYRRFHGMERMKYA